MSHLSVYDGIFGRTVLRSEPTRWPIMPQRPHRCPICEGRGTVPAGFYTQGQSTSTNAETCRACGGRGVVIA